MRSGAATGVPRTIAPRFSGTAAEICRVRPVAPPRIGPQQSSGATILSRCSAAEGEPALDGAAGGGPLPLVQQEVELAAKVALRNPTRFEGAPLERVLERDLRDAPEPEARLDGALDRFGLAQRQRDPELGQQAPHRPVERLPRPRAALADDPVRRQQVR